MKQPLNALIIHDGDAPQDAVPINDHVHMARAVSNSYLVTTPDGDVVINTGMPHQGEEIRARYARVSGNPIRAIVITQGHTDHIGGWHHFTGPGVETITHANFADVRDYWNRLGPFVVRRSGRLWARDRAPGTDPARLPPDPVPTVTFVDSHAFTLGGRRFELYSTPGGETTDSLVVWLPDERTVFTGNLTGPLFGHVPNLYTVRGDKIRSALAFIHSIDRVIALEPELLITGHGEPIRGAEEIRARLTLIRDATAYLRDRTFEGMNAGTDLWTLMREITLPPELDIPQGHGKVPWIVRAIWEEHAGWFRYESTTELYAVPASAVHAELAGLAGGPGPLAARAEAHLAGGRPLEALHIAEIALAHSPGHAGALRVRLGAHELLLERTGRENFSEVRWLESEIRDIREALS
jgi:glyoxylase-like metal-dependent hydrolase (beta-lactamase superfamily II)